MELNLLLVAEKVGNGVWMLYSLFLLVEPNERFIFEGTQYQSKAQCVQMTTQNILKLSQSLVTKLNNTYGENTWKALEIGCVEKGGDPMNRVPIINKNKEKKPEGIMI